MGKKLILVLIHKTYCDVLLVSNLLFFVGHFRKYDFGLLKNLIKYGRFTPPDYNLDNIVTPVALYYSVNDDMTSDIVSITFLFCLTQKHLITFIFRTWMSYLRNFRMLLTNI